MSEKPAIEVQNLGKEYLLGGAESYKDNFREMLTDAVLSPIKKLKRLGGRDQRQERFWALKDVSFNVGSGEVVGIIGRNGAGKSTLLKILSRITAPTEGRVITRGRVASLLEVGTGFHPELTGRENIFLNGAILGMTRKEIQSRFDEIVEFAEVGKFLDTPVKRFSSGMYVRLAFAVAAHLEPEILVVDEVLAVGDVHFQRKCLGKMGDVAEQGRTVLYVSHNLAQIQRLTKRSILLDKGKLMLDLSTEDVVKAYLEVGSIDRSLISGTKALISSSGNERLENFGVIGCKGRSFVLTGECCELKMEAFFENAVINPAFIFSIRTLEGSEILRISTNPISGIETGRCLGKIQCSLTIDRLHLAGGTYALWAGMSIPNVEYLISPTEVGYFEVETGDFYGSGFLAINTFGLMVAEHEWSISKTSD